MSFYSCAYARSAYRAVFSLDRLHACLWLPTVLLASLMAIPARAGVNTFTTIGPEGGRVNYIVHHPVEPSIVYAATASGFYRSSNAGESWVLVSEALGNDPRDIAVHASAPARVFLAVPGEGVFTSENNGVSVSQLSPFPEPAGNIMQVEFNSDGSVLYVSSSSRVFRSTNLGSTWEVGEPVPGEFPLIQTLRAHPADPDILYAITSYATAYRSEDRGASWVAIEVPQVPSFNISGLRVVDPTNQRMWVAGQGGVWFKDEDAATWTDTNFDMGGSTMLAIDPRDPTRVYAGGYYGLSVLPNEGAAWVNIQQGTRVGWTLTLAMHPQDSNRLLLGGTQGVALSLDGGTQWSLQNSEIRSVDVVDIVPVPGADRIYLSSIANGLHVLDAEDFSVTPLNNDELRALGPYPTMAFYGTALHVIPGESDRMLVSLGNGIARSADSGQSWEFLANDAFLNYGVKAITSGVGEGGEQLLAVTQSGLYASTNRGDTWNPIDIPNVDSIEAPVAVAPSNPSLVLLTAVRQNERLVVKSADGGSTWMPLEDTTSIAVQAIAVDPGDDRIVYVSADQHLLKSTNGGESWSDLGFVGVGANRLALDPRNARILYGVDTQNILRSVDGGLSWQALPNAGLSGYWNARALVVDPARPHRLFAALGSHSIKEISIEPDLAMTVTRITSPPVRGTPASYSYIVSNEGPLDASEVVATIRLDASATNISVVAIDISCTRADNVVTCSAPFLKTDQSREILVTATYPSAGTFVATASIDGEQPDPVAGNNALETAVEVGTPIQPPPPAPSGGGSLGGGGGGGGGGGSSGLVLLALLGLLRTVRSRPAARIRYWS